MKPDPAVLAIEKLRGLLIEWEDAVRTYAYNPDDTGDYRRRLKDARLQIIHALYDEQDKINPRHL